MGRSTRSRAARSRKWPRPWTTCWRATNSLRPHSEHRVAALRRRAHQHRGMHRMGYPTGIEWTDATWNPIGGCSIASPGCINCYAQELAGTRLAHLPLYAGTTDLVKGKHVFNGKLT